ncbi:MAG: DMT family transporter [Alphaproteobacteria bacterium]|nr:DMT family transporter [Alphaproteobacteria bacterium]
MTSTPSANRPTVPLLMLLGGLFLFSIQDVLISDLTKRYPVHEIVFVRSLVNIWPLILLSFAFDQGKNMQITKFWQLFLRGGLLSLSYTAYYLALAGLDFAQATSLYFTAPLFITFLSWVTTRVPIGWRRLTGVIIGLVGVVFIVKPGVGEIPLLPALMAVASAFFYALSALMTNWLGRTESTTVQSVTFVIMNLIIGALFWAIFGEGWAVDHAPEGLEVLLKAWVWPSRADVLIMVGIGLGSAIGFIMLTAAYRNLEPSFAAPFEYCLLGYNLLWGLLLFRQVPDALTLVGIAIIVSSGLFVLYREGERRQSLVQRLFRPRRVR